MLEVAYKQVGIVGIGIIGGIKGNVVILLRRYSVVIRGSIWTMKVIGNRGNYGVAGIW